MNEAETVEHCIKVSISRASQGEEEADFQNYSRNGDEIAVIEKRVSLHKVSLEAYVAQYLQHYNLIGKPVPTEIVVKGCWVFTDGLGKVPTNSTLIIKDCKVTVTGTNNDSSWFVSKLVGCDVSFVGKLSRVLTDCVENTVFRNDVYFQSLNPNDGSLIIRNCVFTELRCNSQLDMRGCSLKRF